MTGRINPPRSTLVACPLPRSAQKLTAERPRVIQSHAEEADDAPCQTDSHGDHRGRCRARGRVVGPASQARQADADRESQRPGRRTDAAAPTATMACCTRRETWPSASHRKDQVPAEHASPYRSCGRRRRLHQHNGDHRAPERPRELLEEQTTRRAASHVHEQASVFLGNVEVRAYYFGRGHTNGDAVIYFPDVPLDQVFTQLKLPTWDGTTRSAPRHSKAA